MYRLVACIPILGSYFIKNAKRMCVCDYVKNQIRTCKNVFFRFEKGYKQIIVLDSSKTYYCYKRVKTKSQKVLVAKSHIKVKGEKLLGGRLFELLANRE